MKYLTITINNKVIRVPEGNNLLWAALDNGFYIPNLCALRDNKKPLASCRLCFVKIEGKDEPILACNETVVDRMVVNTNHPKALNLSRTAFELLMASNVVNCGSCVANRNCELQTIAHHLHTKLKSRDYRKLLRELPIDNSSPVFNYDPNKCVLCGRCVWVCRERCGIGVIGFAYRGFKRRVTTFGDRPLGESQCQNCGDCVEICPTGALGFKNQPIEKPA